MIFGLTELLFKKREISFASFKLVWKSPNSVLSGSSAVLLCEKIISFRVSNSSFWSKKYLIPQASNIFAFAVSRVVVLFNFLIKNSATSEEIFASKIFIYNRLLLFIIENTTKNPLSFLL